MALIEIYFILGLAMFLVVLWDYRKLRMTAGRLVRSGEDATGFARIVLGIRNLTVMSLFALFFWPVVLFWEIAGAKGK